MENASANSDDASSDEQNLPVLLDELRAAMDQKDAQIQALSSNGSVYPAYTQFSL
jgi:hypothetical protein